MHIITLRDSDTRVTGSQYLAWFVKQARYWTGNVASAVVEHLPVVRRAA